MKNYQSISTSAYEEEYVARAHPERDVAITGTPDATNPHPQDHLAPPFDSPSRPSSLFVGTFNLVATIMGGGVLSLPVVFQKCGVAFATLGMVLSACMTHYSLVALCHCARRGGGSSYGEAVRSAFGERAELAASWLLFVFLWFVIIAYMMLIRDIWTPLAREATGDPEVEGDVVLLVVAALLLPLLFQRSLHALRWNCYIGSGSIFVLCVALCRGGWQNLDGGSGGQGDDDDAPSSFAIEIFKIPTLSDLLFCFPIMALTFLCHFNVISIQNALSRPTRRRMQNLSKYAVGISFALMYSFGLGGYLYAGNSTQGNILLNVPTARQPGEDEAEYYLFLLGRIGCGVTVIFATPLMMLPCREALLEILDVRFHRSHHRGSESAAGREEGCCWNLFHRCNLIEPVQDAEDELVEQQSITGGPQEDDAAECSPQHKPSSVIIRHDPIQSDYVFRNTLAHYGSTLLIITTCYLVDVAVSEVAVVWSFIGASMALAIGFIVPCGCFVVLEGAVEGADRKDGWIGLAWAILAFSVVGAVVCTINNTIGLWRR